MSRSHSPVGSPRPLAFDDLIREELADLRDMSAEHVAVFDGVKERVAGKACVVATDSSFEPRVCAARTELVGLCLSGGGIRSATFNLGLLEALSTHGVLEHVDYLSTVSGGGYVGGWWMRWLERELSNTKSAPSASAPDRTYRDLTRFFPEKLADESPLRSRGNGTAEVWKLRRFSRFLSPRVGFFESETGAFLTAAIASAVPGLLVGAAILWLAMTSFALLVLGIGSAGGAIWLGGATFAVMALAELSWIASDRADPKDRRTAVAFASIALLALASAALWSALVRASVVVPPALAHVWGDAEFQFEHSAALLSPALAWLCAALSAVAVRTLVSRRVKSHERRAMRNAFDRQISRLLVTAVVWCVLCVVWVLGQLAMGAGGSSSLGGLVSSIAAGVASISWVWGTRSKIGDRPSSGGLWNRIKPLLPQVLAWFALLVITALLAGVSWRLGRGAADLRALGESMQWPVLAAAIALGVALYFFDPSEVSLHTAYRARIARAYLGRFRASEAADDRAEYSDETEEDDVVLRAFGARHKLPVHLICCAANGLADDPVQDLDRGARSAVLSRHGIAVGNCFAPWTNVREAVTLGGALTASAAAVDSNMGSKSKALGPAVTFLLSALNMRLGLWVQREDAGKFALSFPGFLYLCELFGRTHAVDRPRGRGADKRLLPPPALRLSDGGHFENLGLYELVRRHCRYIICSDAGQDGDAGFDDVGNAIRKVRQDFGVEITLDLTPLRPNADGISKQHVAVGDILYPDGDLGVLVLFKPTITGDEPDDVLQYRRRNKAFPHESTGDQFYDQAQWESYRRLGEHAGEASLHALVRDRRDMHASLVFTALRQEWLPGPASLKENLLHLSERCVAFERECRESAPRPLLLQVCPEIRALGTEPHRTQLSGDEWFEAMHVVLQAMQLMEDVWVACELDTHYNHPLNIGWINYFHRWAYAPTFRALWPLLSPILSPGARRFLRERFGLGVRSEGAPGVGKVWIDRVDALERVPAALRSSWELWCKQQGRDAVAQEGERLFVLVVQVHDVGDPIELPIGLARVRIEAQQAGWHHTDLYVMHGLWGGGFGGTFLRELLACGEIEPKSRVWVALPKLPFITDVGAVAEWNDLFQFYACNGFGKRESHDAKTWGARLDAMHCTNAPRVPSEDGAVVLCSERVAAAEPTLSEATDAGVTVTVAEAEETITL